jgi:hypothetical protein
MPAPAALLDECMDLELVGFLRARGFTVESAQLSGLRATDDEVVLDHAARRGWLLITHNERHFRRQHHRRLQQGGSHGGIVCVSQLGPIERLTVRVAMMLDWVGDQEHRSRFFVWGKLQRLLEQGLRLPGYTEHEVHLALGRA